MNNEEKEIDFDFGSLLQDNIESKEEKQDSFDIKPIIIADTIEKVLEKQKAKPIIEQKPKVECQYCFKMILEDKIDDHEEICKKNPRNIKPEIPNEFLTDLNMKMEEILFLAKIGKEHILNEENIVMYLRKLSNSKAKLCDFKRQFHENSSYEIDALIKDMFKRKILTKDKNHFYYLVKEPKEMGNNE